jgi:hypothetical protein
MSPDEVIKEGNRIPDQSAVALTIYPMVRAEGDTITTFIHIDVAVEKGADDKLDLENNAAHKAMDRIIHALPYIMDNRWETLVMPLLSLAGNDTQVAGPEQ